jgi:PAS domain S-box-containing protein
VKNNQPVTQIEQPYPKGRYLVSRTDLKGTTTYANDAYVELSGFTRDELIGKSHNVVRHPDMPVQAFQNLWDTIKAGRPWRGIVKNRCKNGNYYWVDGLVVPIRENDRTTGYMSVRTEPSRVQIQQAEALYRELNQTKRPLSASVPLHKRISLRVRMIAMLAFVAALLAVGTFIGIAGIADGNRALKSSYQDQMKPSVAIAKMVERLGDNRSQIMLALQHSPANPYAKMHDHPVAMHIDAAVKNRAQIESLRADYEKNSKSPEEEALAKTFFVARDKLSDEGNKPARAALAAGDFDKAQIVLLTKINPLYKDVMEKADVLQQYLATNGEKAYSAAEERYQFVRALSIGGFVVGLLLLAVAGFLLLRSIEEPIRRAIGHFDHIAQNVLTDDIDISRQDEAGELMNRLAIMQVHLKVMLDELRLNALAIGSESLRLTGEMTKVVEHSHEQHDRVQSVATAAEEFTQTVAEVADSAGKTSDTAATSRRLVAESATSIASSMTATERVVVAVQDSNTSIDSLNQAIQKIGDITKNIREIADQTNLLALNAAIEAARAGEQGRGFAVVADEVRKLAERTSTSTSDIATTVSEFRAITESAVQSMTLATHQVEDGIGKMRTSVDGLDRITTSSNEVADMAEHIAAAAKEQAAASADVASNVATVSTLIDQNTAIAQEAWHTLESLSGHANSLMELVKKFKLTKSA